MILTDITQFTSWMMANQYTANVQVNQLSRDNEEFIFSLALSLPAVETAREAVCEK